MYVLFAVRQILFEWLVLLIRPLLVGLDWPTARSVLLSHPSLPIEGEAVSAWFDRAWWADWPRLEMGLTLLGFMRALTWRADVPHLAEGLSVGAIGHDCASANVSLAWWADVPRLRWLPWLGNLIGDLSWWADVPRLQGSLRTVQVCQHELTSLGSNWGPRLVGRRASPARVSLNCPGESA